MKGRGEDHKWGRHKKLGGRVNHDNCPCPLVPLFEWITFSLEERSNPWPGNGEPNKLPSGGNLAKGGGEIVELLLPPDIGRVRGGAI